jgi:site-specific recombinase XerD
VATRTPTAPVTRTSRTSQTPRQTRTSHHRAPLIQEPAKVLRRYLLWHEAEGHSRKTERNYRIVLGLFFTYLTSEQQIEDLNVLEVEHVRAWLVYLRNTPTDRGEVRSSKTLENYARHLLGFLHWCVAEGVLDHDPTERVRVPKAEKKHIRVFTDEEVKALHEACMPRSVGLRPDVRRMMTARNRAIVWVLLDTGMRQAELCGMRFKDLDRQRGTIYIMGKGAKERKLLLGQRGYHYLTSYLDHWRGDPESGDDRLILTDDGSPLTEQTITKLFSRLKKASGITDKRVSAHCCRHWYAIRFLLKGGKLFALQRHLGHESLEMVKIYAHFTDQDAEEEKRKYSPADDVPIEGNKIKRRGFRTL